MPPFEPNKLQIDHRHILFIAGVTCSGKTALSIKLATQLNGEVIGADSIQVYKGFDIGSAKPTLEEQSGIPHHLIDAFKPDEPIDAARYATLAREAIDAIHNRGHLPIVVGGTAMWMQSLTHGLAPMPPSDPALRNTLDGIPLQDLHQELKRVDPILSEKLHPNDRLRIQRAIEVYRLTGTPLGVHQQQHNKGTLLYPNHFFMFLDRPRDELYAAIDQRIAKMMESGWIEEVRNLINTYGPQLRPMDSVGYSEIRDLLANRFSYEQTISLIKKHTRVYTRRQRTAIKSRHLHFNGTASDFPVDSLHAWLHR